MTHPSHFIESFVDVSKNKCMNTPHPREAYLHKESLRNTRNSKHLVTVATWWIRWKEGFPKKDF